MVKIADLEDHVDDQHHGHFVLGAPYRWGLHHLRGRPVPTWTADERWFAAPAAADGRIEVVTGL